MHRIRLRSVKQPTDTDDLEVVDPKQFIPDPLRRDDKREPELIDDHIEDLIFPTPTPEVKAAEPQQGPQIRRSVP